MDPLLSMWRDIMKSPMLLFAPLLLLVFVLTGCETREEVEIFEEFTPEEPIAAEISISIESEDRVLVNGEGVAIDELEGHLEMIVREEETHAYIHASPGIDEATIMEVEEIVSRINGIEIHTEREDQWEMDRTY
jgi:biopolymer transport protein ExbD